LKSSPQISCNVCFTEFFQTLKIMLEEYLRTVHNCLVIFLQKCNKSLFNVELQCFISGNMQWYKAKAPFSCNHLNRSYYVRCLQYIYDTIMNYGLYSVLLQHFKLLPFILWGSQHNKYITISIENSDNISVILLWTMCTRRSMTRQEEYT